MNNRGLMIDMDGVIYTGEKLVSGADHFVKRMLKDDIQFTFLSNNSERTQVQAVKKLAGLGIKVAKKHVYTSGMATAAFLKEEFPSCSAYVLGGGGLINYLEESGVTIVEKDADFVVLGEGHDFSLKQVKKGVDMILDGAKFIATNKDPTPRKKGWNNLGIAATAAMIEEAIGREAFVIGKPSPLMMRSAAQYMGLKPEETTVVGDTMQTDIIGGLYMGFKTILVLSGIDDKESLEKFAFKPSLVVDSVTDIKFPLSWW